MQKNHKMLQYNNVYRGSKNELYNSIIRQFDMFEYRFSEYYSQNP